MKRRIFGLENEYGLTCTLNGQRRLSPDNVARYLFEKVIPGARNANVFLENGARLYLDTGFHPEYATPECDDVAELVIHDKAGERIVEDLLHQAEKRLREDGISGNILLFKNNTDSAGNSYGCHENYLVGRDVLEDRDHGARPRYDRGRLLRSRLFTAVAGAGDPRYFPRPDAARGDQAEGRPLDHGAPDAARVPRVRDAVRQLDQRRSDDQGRPRPLDGHPHEARVGPDAAQPRARLGHQAPAHRQLHEPPPPLLAGPEGVPARPPVPPHPARQGRVLPPHRQRPRGPDHRRRHHRAGQARPAADHAGAAAARVHPAGKPYGQGLPRRLGLPEAQRPGARDDPLQGPLPVPRRAGRAAHPLVLGSDPSQGPPPLSTAAQGGDPEQGISTRGSVREQSLTPPVRGCYA